MAAPRPAPEGHGQGSPFQPAGAACMPGPATPRGASCGSVILLHSGSGFQQLGASFELMLRRRGEWPLKRPKSASAGHEGRGLGAAWTASLGLECGVRPLPLSDAAASALAPLNSGPNPLPTPPAAPPTTDFASSQVWALTGARFPSRRRLERQRRPGLRRPQRRQWPFWTA